MYFFIAILCTFLLQNTHATIKEDDTIAFQIGDVWYGENGMIYEGIQATIDDVTSRYVQVAFSPSLDNHETVSYGKHHFIQHFEPVHPLTIFDE